MSFVPLPEDNLIKLIQILHERFDTMNQFTIPLYKLNRFEINKSCIKTNEIQEIINNLNDIIYYFNNKSKDPVDIAIFMNNLKPFSKYI